MSNRKKLCPVCGKPIWQESKTCIKCRPLPSEETKKKYSESHKGQVVSEETKMKLSIINTGKTISKVQRGKISNSLLGHPAWNKGKKASFETRNKISLAHKGKSVSEETRNKLRSYVGEKNSRWKGGVRAYNARNINELRDIYIKGLLRVRGIYEPTSEHIKLTRACIMLKRYMKNCGLIIGMKGLLK